MKKALFLLLFIASSATFVSAQQKFEIGITGISVYDSHGKPLSIDSIQIGQTVTLYIALQNQGAFPVINHQYQQDSFPGGIYYFNYFVDSPHAIEKVDFSHPLPLFGMAYMAHETVVDTFTATAEFFKPDKNNIIITWPSGSKAVGGVDSLDTIPNGSFTFYVYPEPTTAGIPQIASNSFKIYPNPAKDVVNIQMNESGTGIIRLMDMTGKLITSMAYAAKSGENISLPLNEGVAIPDGLYLISIENGNSSNVSKVMICR